MTAPAAQPTGAPETAGPSAAATAAAPGSSRTAAVEGGISGTWTVDPSVGSFDDFSGSFVGYRVKETLASIGATEAVGRTPDVTGSMTVDGSTITAAEFTRRPHRPPERQRSPRRPAPAPGARDRASSRPRRFTLTAPVDLGSEPAEGATVEATATGDLTLHGVTKAVEIPLQARLQGGVVTVAGALPIVFADYGIAKPESMVVLSVEDGGTLEVQLQLTKG